MRRYKDIMALWSIILILTTSMATTSGAAGGNNPYDDSPIRLHTTAMVGPIGAISSAGTFAVNGRIAQGEQLLWGGELLEAPVNSGASVSLDSIGQMNITKGAAVRFATAQSGDYLSGNRVLVASIIRGDMTVTLDEAAGAYVEAGVSSFIASQGAKFKVSVHYGLAVVNTMSGTVYEQQTAQRRYELRPVGSGASISVRTRSTRQLQIQVTDENDKPVPDIPVIFALGTAGGKALGSLGPASSSAGGGGIAGASGGVPAAGPAGGPAGVGPAGGPVSGAPATGPTPSAPAGPSGGPSSVGGPTDPSSGARYGVTTDSNGVARVEYRAGDAKGSDSVTVSADGARMGFTWQITVGPGGGGFWSARNSLILGGLGVAAGVGLYYGRSDYKEVRVIRVDGGGATANPRN